MPYSVKKSGNKWETYNKKTGKVYGKHDTKQGAIDQLAAIKSNTSESFERKLDQAFGLTEDSMTGATKRPTLGASKGPIRGVESDHEDDIPKSSAQKNKKIKKDISNSG